MTTDPHRPHEALRPGAAQVVPLFASASPGPATPGAGDGLRQLRAYWAELCRDGLPPKRSAIDPRRIEAVLHDTFILEAIAPGLARFRVAGLHLADLIGMDVRGMPVSTLILPGARDRFADALDAMFRTPAELHLDLRSPGGLARPALAARMMILPLRDDFGALTRAVGCLIASGQPGRAPRRFEVMDARLAPLSGARPGTPIRPTARPAPEPARPGRPHLRLVHSA